MEKNVKIALLGLPQAGKKTLLTLLTGRHIPEGRKENEAIEGQVPVRDPRVDIITGLVKPEKTKYAETIFQLCPDMHPGEGKREWLESARKCELLCPLVRAFTSDSVYHPAGSIDPERDKAGIRMDLLFADLEMIETRLVRISKEKRGGLSPVQVLEEKALLKCKEYVESDKCLYDAGLEEREITSVRSLGLVTLKPILWVYNVDEKDVKEDAAGIVKISCLIEKDIMGISDKSEREAFLKELGLTSAGVDRLNSAAYDALGLMSFYTMGKDEVRAWTIRKGSTAPVAAGKIHTDMERGFIRAEVIKYDDLIALGSEAKVKQMGKLELKGKDYVIQDGDICSFLFNV